MKNLFLLFLLVLVSYNLFAKEKEITLTWDNANGKIISPERLINLPVPSIRLKFDKKAYQDKKIEFIDSQKNNIILNDLKFGDSKLKATKDFFEIIIESKTKLYPEEILATSEIPKEFKIVVGGDSIKVTLDFTTISLGLKNSSSKYDDYRNGNIYYDAITLSETKDPFLILKILNEHKIDDTDNPYFKKIYNKSVQDTIGKSKLIEVQGGQKESSLALSSIGSLDVTQIADGLAKFLVSRTKEELNVAFFSHLKTVLEDSTYADFKVLFPSTYELLDAIGDEIYNYNRYLINLREAFIADLKVLDSSFPGIINNHQTFFNENFEYAVALNSASYISTSLRNKMHPGEIIATYPLSDYLVQKDSSDYFNKNVSGAVQTLQLFSESLRDTSQSSSIYWVSFDQVKKLANNKDAFYYYLGLVYQKAATDFNGIQYKGSSLTTKLNILADEDNYDANYLAYREYLIGFSRKTDALSTIITNYEKPKNDSTAVEAYALYLKTTIDLVSHVAQLKKLPYVKELIPTYNETEFKKYLRVGEKSADIAIDVNRKNYASAVNNSVVVYNLVRSMPVKDSLDILRNTANRSVKQNKDLERLKSDSINSKSFVSELAKYGAFMASVASAKTSDEVQLAIEAAALPTGSSRIKRESAFNVSLNAYLGLYTGIEDILNTKFDYSGFTFGLSAPIGVAISAGKRKFLGMPHNQYGHWSHSLFISVIDIGAVAAFRFENDSVASVPTIQLKDIVSPGLFYSIGIPKSPISVNLGAQLGPNLRKVYIEDEENPGEFINSYQDNLYIRYSVSVLVDIPIINFHTKSDRKIK